MGRTLGSFLGITGEGTTESVAGFASATDVAALLSDAIGTGGAAGGGAVATSARGTAV
jgi:hypothetical protein